MTEGGKTERPDLFPYSVGTGDKESPALTWVRNHSSYLTVGGFLNYLQITGVYVRGILLNLMVLAPVILLAAIVPGRFHHTLLNYPFAATGFASLLFAVSITVFLVGGPIELLKVVSRRLANDRHRDGSLARIGRERLIACAILALVAGVSIDLTPRLIELFRQNKGSLQLSWPNVSALVVGIATLVGSVSRFLDRFESKKASYAVAIIGFISLLIPYLMLLGVTNYLVYGIVPPRSMYAWLTFICSIAFAASLYIAIRMRLIKEMPRANKVFGIGVTAGFAISIGLLFIAASRAGRQSVNVSEFIGEVSRPLSRLADVTVPKTEGLKTTTAFRELVEKKQLLASLGDVRFSTEGFIQGEYSHFSILRPSAWLNWLEDRDTDAEYFLAASDLIEAGERLDSLDSISKMSLLRLGAEESFQTILSAESKKANAEGEGDLLSVDQTLLSECLRSKLTITDDLQEAIAGLDLNGLAEIIADKKGKDADYSAISQLKLPKRLSAPLLQRTQRDAKGQADPGDALDVDLSGPLLFENLDRSIFDVAWHETMWTTRLSLLRGGDLWAAETVGQLSTVSGLSIDRANQIISDARRRQVASAFTVRQCLQLLDLKDVIHRGIPNADMGGTEVLLSDRVIEAVESLSGVLDQPWSSGRGDEVSKALENFCSQLGLGTPEAFRISCFDLLLDQAIRNQSARDTASLVAVAELFNPSFVYESIPKEMIPLAVIRVKAGEQLDIESLQRLAAIRFTSVAASEPALRRIVLGEFGNLQGLSQLNERVFERAFWAKAIFVLIAATLLLILSWLYVDINRTSAHGFYRDRLSQAFLFDIDSDGCVSSAFDVRLSELADYTNGSVAPFQLINCAVNLQRSADLEIRGEKSDFFTFSAAYAGSDRTGYAPVEVLEDVCPTLSLGTAMAISAGAASPNMGRNTNSLLVFLMTFANLRLGYWLPNPRRVVEDLANNDQLKGRKLLDFSDTRKIECHRVKDRRMNMEASHPHVFNGTNDVESSLCGFACSGGGIRSAAINLGIAQTLHTAGLFPMFDFLSTVSGGGYFGSSISASMRTASRQGTGSLTANSNDQISPSFKNGFDPWITGYRWVTRPTHYLKEMTSWLNDEDTWINLSDGGHIENLGFYELLRRRCRFIVVGDGEADPNLEFPSLTFAIQVARARLNTTIEWLPESIHLWSHADTSELAVRPHHALGRIQYPGDKKQAYVLYLKSSVNGDEPADVRCYGRQHVAFPHESTADQFFDPSQFEAYRELGKHIAESAFTDIGIAIKQSTQKSVSLVWLMNRLNELFPDQASDHVQ